MTIDVKGKVAIVTGAAMGIGMSCAKTLAEAGAKIMVTDILDDEGEDAAGSIRAAGYEAHFLHLDVTSEGGWAEVVDGTIDMFGGFNILVNNAGIFDVRFLSDTSLTQWKKLMTTNIDGVFLGTREAVRAMRPQGVAGQGGSIINISSCAALKGSTGHSAYCASKAAVHLFSKAVAVECADLNMGIRVNTVHPAVIESPMSQAAMKSWADTFMEGDIKAMNEEMIRRHPMGRLGIPEEVAYAVLYLASDASGFSTGVEIKVDGGYAI